MRALLGLLLSFGGITSGAQSASSADATAQIGQGYELVQNSQFAEAAEHFRTALVLDPSVLSARYQLAICLFALGDTESSRKEFERLRIASKDDPNVLYYLARIDLLTGDAPSAIRRLVPLMKHPPFVDAPFYLGSAYLAIGDLDNAITWLRKAPESDPHDFRSHYRLARALQQKGLQQQAEQEYAVSTRLREHYNQTARQSTACVQAWSTESTEQARKVCNRLFDPHDSDKLTTLGILYGESGRYQDAIEPLARAALLDPESFEVYHNLGLTYFRLQRFALAREPLEHAVRLRPNFFGSNALLGATLYSLKDDPAAYSRLRFAHELKPDDADTTELLFRVSVILADKAAAAADYKASLAFLSTATTLRPGIPEIEYQITAITRLRDQSH